MRQAGALVAARCRPRDEPPTLPAQSRVNPFVMETSWSRDRLSHVSPFGSSSMNLQVDLEPLLSAHETVREALRAERTVGGHWVGEVAGSPLATATAVSALVLAHGSQSGESSAAAGVHMAVPDVLQGDLSELIVESLHWLARRQNEDGGWGDTSEGRSNLAATMLACAAFRLTCVPAKYEGLTDRAEDYIAAQGGVAALKKQHGKDRSFVAPVLANCALAGLVPWRQVPALPFEMTCLPQAWYPRLRLPVTSYAIPLMVATGQLKYRYDPPRNPLRRLLRMAARKGSLAVAQRMQPENGGYMESTPLTAFVVMGLAGIGLGDHPTVTQGIEFLLSSVRSDASWPIVTNLATWNTTLAISALAERPTKPPIARMVSGDDATASQSSGWHDTVRSDETLATGDELRVETRSNDEGNDSDLERLDEKCLDWLLDAQHFEPNTCTAAKCGGWAWTDLAGGVPNSDDTAGALLALANWYDRYPRLKQHRLALAARRGVEWLVDIQNADGGWPTFARGWNAQRLDRSASDVTAHALRALAAWQRVWKTLPPAAERSATPVVALEKKIRAAILNGFVYLEYQQRNDGSFVPHWYGNQHHPDGHNLVYGTARVLVMCAELDRLDSDMAERAGRWLLGVQHANGGWGPPRSSPATNLSNIYRSNVSRAEDALASYCSIEETALAVEALLPLVETNQLYARSVQNGLRWLTDAVERGRLRHPAPIGFYFARLWYHERLYPLVFATGALGRAIEQLAPRRSVVAPVG
jgi:squalene-hopene/tetraprenyl-beta-curcumene cyclase